MIQFFRSILANRMALLTELRRSNEIAIATAEAVSAIREMTASQLEQSHPHLVR